MNIFKRKNKSPKIAKPKYRVARYDDVYIAEVHSLGSGWEGIGSTGHLWCKISDKLMFCNLRTEELAQRRLEKFYNPTVMSEWVDSDDIGK